MYTGDGDVDPATLLAAARAGDAAALDAFLRHVRPQVYRYVLARLVDRNAADDVTQEVAVAIVSALPRYVEAGKPLAWVFGIAMRKVSEAHRALLRRREAVLTSMPDHPCAAASGEPEAVTVQLDTARRMAELLAILPPPQGEILRLRIAAGLTADETAALLGMTAGAVRVAQHRALATLRSSVASEVLR